MFRILIASDVWPAVGAIPRATFDSLRAALQQRAGDPEEHASRQIEVDGLRARYEVDAARGTLTVVEIVTSTQAQTRSIA